MAASGRRDVDPELLPERLKSDGTRWWVEVEESWSWSLWRNNNGDLALDVVCGSVGLWEEWVSLSETDLSRLRDALRLDDRAALTVIAAAAVKKHECGKRTL